MPDIAAPHVDRVMQFSKEQHDEFARMWLDDSVTMIDVAIHFMEQMTALRSYAYAHGLGAKRVRLDGARIGYEPSQEEIERECKRIQQTWTPDRFGCRE